MNQAVFLDRDGVINRAYIRDGKSYPPASLKEVEILPGVKSALKKLRAAGYLLIVVTNQPDVSKGLSSKKNVNEINNFLGEVLPLDEFHTCFHADIDGCQCRKPLPGLLLMSAMKHNIDLKASFMIGDRWRDIEAGHAAGCKTFFINYGYKERQPASPDFIVESLLHAAKVITGEQVEKNS